MILTAGYPRTDEDKALISELVRVRVRQEPHGLVITQVTAADLQAWRDGRTEEAIRGIEHRWQHGKTGEDTRARIAAISEELAEAGP